MDRINIAGAGIAGLSAAIALAEKGIPSLLISVHPSERAQSVMAEGGINACLDTMGEHDTVEEHFRDTMKGGVFIADEDAVRSLTSHAPEMIDFLERIGVPFNRENGHVIQRNFGGQKKKRTAFARSSTGKIIMSALIDEVRRYEAAGLVRRLCHHNVTGIDIRRTDSGLSCEGLWLCDTYTDRMYYSRGHVIAAWGGMNGLFPGHTTGTAANTGRLTADVFLRGVTLSDLEFIQYHPTTVDIGSKRLLLTEAARGEGGKLFIERDGKPWYFMEELYPESGSLSPRDVVSREMYRVCQRDDCKPPVYLDMRMIDKPTWESKLSDLRSWIIYHLGTDPVKEPVAVSPGIHFFMGGIDVDKRHRTDAVGLYAAGECACQYHGANRLGGNSLLGALWGGRQAAYTAAEETGECENGEPAAVGESEGFDVTAYDAGAAEMCGILVSGLGIVRDEQTMRSALDRLDGFADAHRDDPLHAGAVLGQAMLLSALARRESRGAHSRSDHPQRDDERFGRRTYCRYKDGKIQIQI